VFAEWSSATNRRRDFTTTLFHPQEPIETSLTQLHNHNHYDDSNNY